MEKKLTLKHWNIDYKLCGIRYLDRGGKELNHKRKISAHKYFMVHNLLSRRDLLRHASTILAVAPGR